MPPIFADPRELHTIADHIARHADAVRSSAVALAAGIAGDRWRGVAAEIFAAQAGSVLSDMRACARRLDDAADALHRHAGRVQGALEYLAQAWRNVEEVSGEVGHDISHFIVGGVVVDGAFAELLTRANR